MVAVTYHRWCLRIYILTHVRAHPWNLSLFWLTILFSSFSTGLIFFRRILDLHRPSFWLNDWTWVWSRSLTTCWCQRIYTRETLAFDWLLGYKLFYWLVNFLLASDSFLLLVTRNATWSLLSLWLSCSRRLSCLHDLSCRDSCFPAIGSVFWVRISTWRHPTPCWNFSVLTVWTFCSNPFLD